MMCKTIQQRAEKHKREGDRETREIRAVATIPGRLLAQLLIQSIHNYTYAVKYYNFVLADNLYKWHKRVLVAESAWLAVALAHNTSLARAWKLTYVYYLYLNSSNCHIYQLK